MLKIDCSQKGNKEILINWLGIFSELVEWPFIKFNNTRRFQKVIEALGARWVICNINRSEFISTGY
jgi:hypothetical protein